jgi:hypothetical protein
VYGVKGQQANKQDIYLYKEVIIISGTLLQIYTCACENNSVYFCVFFVIKKRERQIKKTDIKSNKIVRGIYFPLGTKKTTTNILLSTLKLPMFHAVEVEWKQARTIILV